MKQLRDAPRMRGMLNPARHCAKCVKKLQEHGGKSRVVGLCFDCTEDILHDEYGRKVSLDWNYETRILKGIKLWHYDGAWRAW